MTAKEKNKLAGIFLLAHGGLQMFVMIILVLVYGGVGSALFFGASKQEDQFVGLMFIGIILILIVVTAIFVSPQLIGGWKMFKERPNARTWGVIGSIVSCLSFPFGTAAGVFGLVFLLGEEGTRFYLGGGDGYKLNSPTPPPPSSWQ
jgi:hypothetical protein